MAGLEKVSSRLSVRDEQAFCESQSQGDEEVRGEEGWGGASNGLFLCASGQQWGTGRGLDGSTFDIRARGRPQPEEQD